MDFKITSESEIKNLKFFTYICMYVYHMHIRHIFIFLMLDALPIGTRVYF